MKTSKTIESHVCDFCKQSDQCYDKCVTCGKDVCYDCKKVAGVEYPHSVCCSGSGDGFYCHECDAKDSTSLHAAYVAIRSLRLEAESFYRGYRERSEKAELRLKELQGRK